MLCLLNIVTSSAIHIIANDKISSFSMAEQYPHVLTCVCAFNSRCKLGLLSFLSYCVWDCNKHGGADVALKDLFRLLWIHTQQWGCWVIWQVYF